VANAIIVVFLLNMVYYSNVALTMFSSTRITDMLNVFQRFLRNTIITWPPLIRVLTAFHTYLSTRLFSARF